MRRSLWTVGLAVALSISFFVMSALADVISGFTEKVSPDAEMNATEPPVAIHRSDGTVSVAWQASGTHGARSGDGGRSCVQPATGHVCARHERDVGLRVGG